MEVGDMLVCKDNSTEYADVLTIGKSYRICEVGISKDNFGIMDDSNSIRWYSNQKYNWYMYDYFCTPDEERKMKLERLNGI